MLSLVTRSSRLAAARPALSRALSKASAVKVMTVEDEFETTIASDSLSVVYFTAAWCGPCRMISPVFEMIAEQHSDATFLKVDVDEQAETAAAAQVSAMPTFQFYKSGKLLDKIVGADVEKLKIYTEAHSKA